MSGPETRRCVENKRQAEGKVEKRAELQINRRPMLTAVQVKLRCRERGKQDLPWHLARA